MSLQLITRGIDRVFSYLWHNKLLSPSPTGKATNGDATHLYLMKYLQRLIVRSDLMFPHELKAETVVQF